MKCPHMSSLNHPIFDGFTRTMSNFAMVSPHFPMVSPQFPMVSSIFLWCSPFSPGFPTVKTLGFPPSGPRWRRRAPGPPRPRLCAGAGSRRGICHHAQGETVVLLWLFDGGWPCEVSVEYGRKDLNLQMVDIWAFLEDGSMARWWWMGYFTYVFSMVVNINLMVRYVKPTGMVNKWRFPYW